MSYSSRRLRSIQAVFSCTLQLDTPTESGESVL